MTKTFWRWLGRRIIAVLADEALKAIEERRAAAEDNRKLAEHLLAEAKAFEAQAAELERKKATDPLAGFVSER